MNYFYFLLAVLTGVYAYTYAVWLKQNDGRLGWKGVLLLIIVSQLLSLYRFVK